MICKICQNPSEKIFEKTILQKHRTGYYKCISCSFVQTDEPFWLEEAYQSTITSLDIGLLSRNNDLRGEVSRIIDSCFPEAEIMIDFAGGYGVFVRLMRDAGYNFYRQDDYCENIFAKHFDVADAPVTRFDLLTGFEVMEHFNNPIEEIERVFKYSDHAIFSTELLPENDDEIENWWYLAQETGQHIAFYSDKAMRIIAEKNNKNYYSKHGTIHVFTDKIFDQDQIDYGFKNIDKRRVKKLFRKPKYNRITKYDVQRTSLLQQDYLQIKNMLNL